MAFIEKNYEKNMDSLDDHNSIDSEEDISKYFKGTHEVQECFEGQGEEDLYKHLLNCDKNPGHRKFIAINLLSGRHLPSEYHDNDLYDLTKTLADLTVRIAVKFISPDRPEFVPGTKDPYPCYNTKGQNSLRTGTGRVWEVYKYTEENYRTCPCPECDHSDTPSNVWWKVRVRTVKSVVFDESEARQSTCRLWFDEDNSPVVNIYGWRVDESNINEDGCVLHCVTHDLHVGETLANIVGQFNGLRIKVNKKYNYHKYIDNLTIIVSHPHGCSKQFSVGHLVHGQVLRRRETRFAYTTCTCPGSSGALVYILGSDWMSNHAHSGTNSGGLNYSGLWYDKGY